MNNTTQTKSKIDENAVEKVAMKEVVDEVIKGAEKLFHKDAEKNIIKLAGKKGGKEVVKLEGDKVLKNAVFIFMQHLIVA